MSKAKVGDQKIVKVLHEAIELAGIAGGRKVSNRAIVERIYDSEPALMAEYQREWSIDRMLWMIARERRERYAGRGADAPEIVSMQINLPGFEDLPQTIFLRNGRRQKLDYANVTQVTEHIAMLKARMERSPKIIQFEAMVKVMRKYSTTNPDIRWIEVKRAELKSNSPLQ